MSKRSQPLYVASEEQRRRLFAFSEKLKSLCDEYKVDLSANSDSISQITIELRDDRRPKQLKTDWPFMAYFEGADQKGCFYRSVSGHAITGLDLADYDSTDKETIRLLREAGLLGPPKKTKRAAKPKAGGS